MIMMSLVERRVAERYEVALRARVTTNHKDSFSALVSNLSMSGIQIKVENSLIPQLMPAIERANKIDTIPVEVEVELPELFKAVTIKLGIVYFNRISLTHSVVGCRFEGFVKEGARTLSEYILHIQHGGVSRFTRTMKSNEQAD